MATRLSEQVDNKMATITISDEEVEKMSTMLSNQGVLIEQGRDTKLIADCFALHEAIGIDTCILRKFIIGKYPNVHMEVLSPVPYARVVKKIGNEMDLALVDLKEVLSLADIVASMGRASGLSALANIPADDFSLVGAKKIMDLQRFFAEMPQFHYLLQSNFKSDIRGRFKFLAFRYVARNSTVAGRVDWTRGDPTGKALRSKDAASFAEEIAMGKWGKIQAKKPQKMKALVINMVEWDEGWDERRAKLEAINKLRAVFEVNYSSRVISSGEFDFKRKESFLPVEDGSTNNAIYEKFYSADMQAIKWGIKEVEKVKDIWQLIQVGCTGGVLRSVDIKIEPCCDGKLVFDGGRVAALLVLAISAPLSHEKHTFSIPPRIFSYAVTLLGRISNALSDVMDQDTLLAYLSHCSCSTIISSGEFDYKRKELFLPVEDGSTNNPIYEKSCSAVMQLQKLNGGASGSQCQKMGETRKVVKALLNYQVEDHGEVIKSVEFILEKVKDIWQSWKEELAKFPTSSSAGAFAFSLQHLRIAKLLAKLWPHFISPRKLSCGMGELGLLLGKLDRTIKEMKYRFMGLSKQEELHVLELILLNCVLRLSSIEAFSDGSTLKKLHSTLSLIESVYSELSMEPSKFQFVFSVKLKHIKAELYVSGNDYDNPFPFIPGLLVGIRLGITLYNISRENRLWLWLRLAVDDDLSEFVYLDFDRFGGNNQFRKFRFVAPFYKTPKSNSFTVKVCLGLECLFDNVHSFKSCGGPKQELVYLCKQKEVFLSTVEKE
ncbi:hypothetical protein RHSIM_Rhsim05G0226000 [Rhododendron simsii]|uniref:Nop domain-containing protein n=1 Tax=Rhododendron simsii TaxID=118357 RepID=A0A834GV55_RHOSS|nr:hypothetical protein RHSIM_Rhsim05G0226000 [Rhododendron simsii]